ncbi:hypothetical protein CEXT_677461 [Caerostris extrusa]|uniref:Uncharacterized protein n=1 Tax=Caerostris extrusa TaxID=172846 RepID=A0AAV4M9E8_CAEEX|nr:hypothetical protein CEXT_677461 [Caerostris extrusa]
MFPAASPHPISSLISLLSYPSTVQFSLRRLQLSSHPMGLSTIAILASTFSTFLSALVLRSLHPPPTRYGLGSSSLLISRSYASITQDITSISDLSSNHNPVSSQFNANYITLNIPLNLPPTGKPLPTLSQIIFPISDHFPYFLQILIIAMILKPLWIISLLISLPPQSCFKPLHNKVLISFPSNQTSNLATSKGKNGQKYRDPSQASLQQSTSYSPKRNQNL